MFKGRCSYNLAPILPSPTTQAIDYMLEPTVRTAVVVLLLVEPSLCSASTNGSHVNTNNNECTHILGTGWIHSRRLRRCSAMRAVASNELAISIISLPGTNHGTAVSSVITSGIIFFTVHNGCVSSNSDSHRVCSGNQHQEEFDCV